LLFNHAFFFRLIRTFASILNFLYVSWLALVFCWSHLDLASFHFFYMLSALFIPPFISSSSALCLYNFVCCVHYCFFRSFPFFIDVIRIWSVFSLLCNDVLYCLSLLGSCIFVLFHFVSWIGFFLYMFGNFCFRVVFSR